jgi:hypothetical protein
MSDAPFEGRGSIRCPYCAHDVVVELSSKRPVHVKLAVVVPQGPVGLGA